MSGRRPPGHRGSAGPALGAPSVGLGVLRELGEQAAQCGDVIVAQAGAQPPVEGRRGSAEPEEQLLAGVRFSGFSQDTTSTLIEYITQVQTLNDRKTAIIGLLSRLQKPITEQLTAGQKTTIGYVVFLGKQDPSRNPFAMLAPLQKPIEAACPSATSGSIAQLGSQLNHVITDIRGEQALPGGDVVTESKPGLLDRADKLVTNLNKVQ